jgi:hypothetical protein
MIADKPTSLLHALNIANITVMTSNEQLCSKWVIENNVTCRLHPVMTSELRTGRMFLRETKAVGNAKENV